MWTKFPDINQQSTKEDPVKDVVSKKQGQTPPKINVKGITLKEYFRICDDNKFHNTIDEMDEESCSSLA